MSNKRYAIWYEPIGETFIELDKIILFLSKKYNSPIFTPHITLLPGGSSLDKDIVVDKLNNIIKKIKPFATTLSTLEYTDEYFKSIFVRVEKTTELMSFAEKIQKGFNGEKAKNYEPHLSILYGQFQNQEKERIIKTIGDKIHKSFILKKADVIEYEFNQPPETWKKVASIEL